MKYACSASSGFLPRIANRTTMVTIVRPIAISGEISAIAFGLADVEGLGCAVDRLQGGRSIDEAVMDHAAGGVPGEQRILRKFHARRGAVAEPLLGNESRAELAALRDREMAGSKAFDHD